MAFTYLLFGAIGLAAILLVARLLAKADPATFAAVLKWVGGTLAALLMLFLVVRGYGGAALMMAALAFMMLRRRLGGRPTNPFARREVQSGSEDVIRLRDLGDRDDVAGNDPSDVGDSTLAEGLLRIKRADPNFTRAGFLEGSQAAFEIVVGAYAAGDTDALRPILADDVYRRFARAIRDRAGARRSLKTTVVSNDGSEIIEAGMNGRTAMVTVRFTTHQINVTRDADEHVVAGDPREAVEVVDIWTFERDTRSRDPIWNLVATRIPN